MNTKTIDGFAAYRVRSDGVLETNWRICAHYPGMPCKDKWRTLPCRENKDGYRPVHLRGLDGKARRTYLHRVVAEAFLGNPPHAKACVRHLDGNKKNNNASNLAWGTYQDNENDKRRHGTWDRRITNGKLAQEKMDSIRRLILDGKTQETIAKLLGVTRPTVSRFLNGKTWQ